MSWWNFGRNADKAPQQSRQEPIIDQDVIKMMRNRMPRKSKRMFAAAEQDRLAMDWGTQPLTADEVVQKNWRAVTARAQEQAANNDYGKNYLRMCVNNIIGQRGIQLRALAKGADKALDRDANAAIERAWRDFCKKGNCDVTGKKSMREQAKQAVKSAATTGEFCFRMVFGADAGKYGVALQAIPVTRIPVDMTINRMPASTNFVRFGIEFTQYGKPVAYYFTTLMSDEDRFMYSGKPYIRVPADEVLHHFIEDLAGQKRGLSWLATSLVRMRQLNGMEEAALVNARVGASKMAFVTFPEGDNGPEYDEDNPPIIEVEPGEMDWLPQGAKLEKWDPQYPAGDYAQFTKDQKRGIAAGVGVSYHNLAQDLEGVNFSSIRQGTLDERETWKDLQEWLIEGMMQPIFDAWLPRALLAGLIVLDNGKPLSPLKLEKYQDISWQARRWDWIDPDKDITAAIKAKNTGLKSPSAIIQDDGHDPQQVWEQTARDVKDQIDKFVAAGVSQKNAEMMVLTGMGVDYHLLQEQPNAEAENGGGAGGAAGE